MSLTGPTGTSHTYVQALAGGATSAVVVRSEDGGERRIEPLETDHPRGRLPALAPGGDGRLDGPEPLAQALHKVDGRILDGAG